MKAKKMFEGLGYETNCWWQKDHTIEYAKYEDDEFYGTRLDCSIIFHKRTKKVKIVGACSIDELKAINQQCKELGWLDE